MKSLISIIIISPFLMFGETVMAECPPKGCPTGQVCAGNPIYSTCVDKKSYKASDGGQEAGGLKSKKIATEPKKNKKERAALRKKRKPEQEKKLRKKSDKPSRAMKESGEKGGTADINIGVGE